MVTIFLLLFVPTTVSSFILGYPTSPPAVATDYTQCPHLSRWNEQTSKCACPNETVLYNQHCSPCGENTQWSEDGCTCHPHHERITELSCAPIACVVGTYNETTEACECSYDYLLDNYGKCTIQPCGPLEVWNAATDRCMCKENHVVLRKLNASYEWVESCVECGAFTKRTPAGTRICECLPYYEGVPSFNGQRFECRPPECLNGTFSPERGCVCDAGFVMDVKTEKCKKWDQAAEALSAEVAGLRIVNAANDTRLCLWEDSYEAGAKITVAIKKKRIRGVPALYIEATEDGTVGAGKKEADWRSEQEWTPVKNDDGSWKFQSSYGGWLSSDGNRTLYATNKTLDSPLQSFKLDPWEEDDDRCPSLARYDTFSGGCRCMPNYVWVQYTHYDHQITMSNFCVPCGAFTKWTPTGCECLPFYERVDVAACRPPVCPHGFSFDPARGCVCGAENETDSVGTDTIPTTSAILPFTTPQTAERSSD